MAMLKGYFVTLELVNILVLCLATNQHVFPEQEYVPIGGAVVFRCNSAFPTWMGKSYVIKPDRNFIFRGNFLIILDVDQWHSGHYMCSGESYYGTYFEEKVSLIVTEAASKTTVHPPIAIINNNGHALFKCIHNLPVSWTFEGKPLPQHYYVGSSNVVLIPRAEPLDAGVYSCHGEHNYKKFTSCATLKIRDAGHYGVSLQSAFEKEGSSIQIECYSATPPLWTKSGKDLPKDAVKFGALLNISKIRLFSHKGEYTCEGTTDTGDKFAKTFALHVATPVDEDLQWTHAIIGQQARLSCKSTIDVIWHFNNHPLELHETNFSTYFSRTINNTEENVHFLVIKRVTKDSEGTYTCYGKSSEMDDYAMFYQNLPLKIIPDKLLLPERRKGKKFAKIKTLISKKKLKYKIPQPIQTFPDEESFTFNYFNRTLSFQKSSSMNNYCPKILLKNGRVLSEGNMVGSTVTFTCLEGYHLHGGGTRLCLPGGEWSGRDSFCQSSSSITEEFSWNIMIIISINYILLF